MKEFCTAEIDAVSCKWSIKTKRIIQMNTNGRSRSAINFLLSICMMPNYAELERNEIICFLIILPRNDNAEQQETQKKNVPNKKLHLKLKIL